MKRLSKTPRVNQQVRLPPALVDVSLLLTLLFLRVYASWLCWVDPLVDFGRELYIPWRITEGDVLFRDIASFYGPFSAYFNAAVFALGGVSIATLATANAVIAAVLMTLIYLTVREIGSRLAAILAAVTFVFVFSCGPVLGLALFNYMAPYSHDLTHGLTLAIAAMLCLVRFIKQPGRNTLIGCGFLLGLTFLTKPEVFVAAAGAAAVALALVAVNRTRNRPEHFGRWLLLFLAAAVAPAILAIVLLSLAMPLSTAARGVVGSWPHLFDTRVTGLPFFRWLRGTDNLSHQLGMIAKSAGFWIGCLAAVFAFAASAMTGGWAKKRPAAIGLAIAAGVMIATALVALVIARLLPVTMARQQIVIAQALPLILLVLIAWLAWELLRRADAPPLRIAQLVAALFALGMLAKIFFYTRFDHYGFALAMPAAIGMAVFLVDAVPALARRFAPTAPTIARGGALGVLAFVLWITCPVSGMREIPLNFGPDSFVFVPVERDQANRGPMIRDAVKFLASETSPSDRIAVLPEGVMINYLTRRKNPTPYVNVLPPEHLMWGGKQILAEFSAHPPTWIVLVHRPTPEYGVPLFGTDYAPELLSWVRGNYETRITFGRSPLQSPSQPFGIEILRRK